MPSHCGPYLGQSWSVRPIFSPVLVKSRRSLRPLGGQFGNVYTFGAFVVILAGAWSPWPIGRPPLGTSALLVTSGCPRAIGKPPLGVLGMRAGHPLCRLLPSVVPATMGPTGVEAIRAVPRQGWGQSPLSSQWRIRFPYSVPGGCTAFYCVLCAVVSPDPFGTTMRPRRWTRLPSQGEGPLTYIVTGLSVGHQGWIRGLAQGMSAQPDALPEGR